MKYEHIYQSILEVQLEPSELPEEVLSIGGFTSPNIRNLMNRLGKISTKYLEVGTHRGATFFAATYGNQLKAVAIDNFSEFEDGTVENEFRSHLKAFNSSALVVKADCFTADIPDSYKGIDLYLYDGAHDYESQKKAITKLIDWMADEFIFCVDDYDWEDVQRGTMDGIAEAGLDILYEIHLSGKPEEWWNGFGVLLLKKKA